MREFFNAQVFERVARLSSRKPSALFLIIIFCPLVKLFSKNHCVVTEGHLTEGKNVECDGPGTPRAKCGLGAHARPRLNDRIF